MKALRIYCLYVLICIGTFCIGSSVYAIDTAPIPHLTAPVMDTAAMMTPSARHALNQHLLDYAQQHGSQIVVLTVDRITPETPFDYATRVMDTWQLGRKGIDDGVLLLLVNKEHKTFLAVGRGLESAIPDVYAKRILDDVLRPYLQQGETDKGIEQVVSQIEKLIAGESLSPPHHDQPMNKKNFIFFAAITYFLISLLKPIFGHKFGFVFAVLIAILFGLWLGFALWLSILLAIALSLLIYLHIFFGGGGFGGSSGGDGFSGGGGGFGGGGASGGW